MINPSNDRREINKFNGIFSNLCIDTYIPWPPRIFECLVFRNKLPFKFFKLKIDIVVYSIWNNYINLTLLIVNPLCCKTI